MLKKKTTKKKASSKKVAVNRKFLLKLADTIYNPKTKDFLRLCDGVLQNGPDPTDKKRPMHCGLGELYFAMTGLQPEETGIDEEGVVNLAVELSPVDGLREQARDAERSKFEDAKNAIQALDLDETLKDDLVSQVEGAADDFENDIEDTELNDLETQFRAVLDDIPSKNDDGCGDHGDGGSCTIKEYRARSKRVAEKLREAAEILPR